MVAVVFIRLFSSFTGLTQRSKIDLFDVDMATKLHATSILHCSIRELPAKYLRNPLLNFFYPATKSMVPSSIQNIIQAPKLEGFLSLFSCPYDHRSGMYLITIQVDCLPILKISHSIERKIMSLLGHFIWNISAASNRTLLISWFR